MIDVQKPVGDVDPVDHQVGEEAAAEIPEPAPVAEAVLVERLVGGVAEEVLPGDLAGIDADATRAEIVSSRLGSSVRWILNSSPIRPLLTSSRPF